MVECYWCCGTAVDEEGCVCVACAGTTKVPWSLVVSMQAEDRYPVEVRLEQEGAAFVAAASEALR